MFLKKCLSIAIIIGLSSLTFAQSSTRGMSKVISSKNAMKNFDKTWAMVIGIDNYEKAAHLKFAVNDSRAMRDMLVKEYGVNPKNMIELYDSNATRKNIIRGFEKLSQETKTQDRVIIFYAGHGITIPLPENRERGYILPIDGDANNPISTAISTDQLSELTEGIPAKHLYAIMDACYGGLIFSRATPMSAETEDFVETVSMRRTRQALTAGGRDQPVFDTGPGGHSVFTFHLLEGLRTKSADLDKNGVITASEIAAYIMPRVTAESRKQQTPQYGILVGDRGGEFVFIPQPKVATLAIASNVPGARVYVDDRFEGVTPIDVDMHEFGVAKISVSFDGYMDKIMPVKIQNESESIFAALDKSARLRINSEPSGAQVYIDDSLYGKTPILLPKVAQSKHQIKLAMTDYADILKEIDISNKDVLTVDQQLEKKKSSVSLTGAAGKASVIFKGSSNRKMFASLPVKKVSLDYDTYDLIIEKEGYSTFSSSIDIRKDNFSIPVRLEQKSLLTSRISSTFLPGSGQIYLGRSFVGWSLLGSSLLSAGATLYSLNEYNKYRDNYDLFNSKYKTAKSVADLDKYYALLSSANDNMQKNKNFFFISAGVTGAIFLYSIVDAIIFEPEPLMQNERLSLKTNGNTIQLEIGL